MLCLVNVATTTVTKPMTLAIAQGSQNQTHYQTTSNNKAPIISLLANNLANRLNKSAAILEITSKLPEVKNHAYASSLNQTLHGIAAEVDIQKRKVAQDILSVDKDFGVIFFLMPNGLVYMAEPYSRQLNLTKSNFDFRDYYKGAVSTHTTYLGNVIISASSGFPQANIAVPVYSENNNNSSRQSLLGIWAGGLNLAVFNRHNTFRQTSKESDLDVGDIDFPPITLDLFYKRISSNHRNQDEALSAGYWKLKPDLYHT
jgi:hypothetical protein